MNDHIINNRNEEQEEGKTSPVRGLVLVGGWRA
jgi:hypothetical protein